MTRKAEIIRLLELQKQAYILKLNDAQTKYLAETDTLREELKGLKEEKQ